MSVGRIAVENGTAANIEIIEFWVMDPGFSGTNFFGCDYGGGVVPAGWWGSGCL